VRKRHPGLIDSGRVALLTADGRLGYAAHAPYDAIHVGAAFDELPRGVLAQLRVGGALVAPVGRGEQALVLVTRENHDTFHTKALMGVRYVPMTSVERQLAGAAH
jgi:protein-L-isoaspartate(D-aspartate) O-methyltransferase